MARENRLKELPGGVFKMKGGTFGGPTVDRSQRPLWFKLETKPRQLREKESLHEALKDFEYEQIRSEAAALKGPIQAACFDHRSGNVSYDRGLKERVRYARSVRRRLRPEPATDIAV